MHSSNKHSTLKGILLTLGAWCRSSLHGHPYRGQSRGRPDRYKKIERDTIRKPNEDLEDKIIDKI